MRPSGHSVPWLVAYPSRSQIGDGSSHPRSEVGGKEHRGIRQLFERGRAASITRVFSETLKRFTLDSKYLGVNAKDNFDRGSFWQTG